MSPTVYWGEPPEEPYPEEDELERQFCALMPLVIPEDDIPEVLRKEEP